MQLLKEKFVSLTSIRVREKYIPKANNHHHTHTLQYSKCWDSIYSLSYSKEQKNFQNFTNLTNDHTLQLVYKAANKEHQNTGLLHCAEILQTHFQFSFGAVTMVCLLPKVSKCFSH